MTHDKQQTLKQIFCRLCFHTGFDPKAREGECRRFVEALAPYPEDLICAAYHHLMRHPEETHLHMECDFIDFMAPEYARRTQQADVKEEA